MKLPTRPRSDPNAPFTNKVASYFNIIFAIMMHDIKNRFFGSGLGQIVMIIWPFAHMLVIITIYVFSKRPNPYGESLIQYSAVSIFPFICFNYVCRWIVYTANSNKSFLQYPIIKPLDLLISRALLEIVSITLVGILIVIFVSACGYNVMPSHPEQAILAVLATLFLAIGFGFLNAPFAFIIPLWVLFITLVIIVTYASSGIIFVPATMPEQIRYYLSFNPLLDCIEWMRTAYYDDYPTSMLDKAYPLEFGLVSLTLGLILLKAFRPLIR